MKIPIFFEFAYFLLGLEEIIYSMFFQLIGIVYRFDNYVQYLLYYHRNYISYIFY